MTKPLSPFDAGYSSGISMRKENFNKAKSIKSTKQRDRRLKQGNDYNKDFLASSDQKFKG
jgi:hypothetical protein